MNSFNVPILFLVFNRLDTTIRTFEIIRKVKPKRLYIAADGYRNNFPNEKIVCEQVRNYILENIDWDCKVSTLFRENNLGCGLAVSGAIKWFFSCVDEGIIIEDDCLLDNSFFEFCKIMLEKHRYNENVGLIGSVYLDNERIKISDSYYFSIYPEIWGWATWKRTIEKYDYDMTQWGKLNKRKFLKKILRKNEYVNYWMEIFDLTYLKKIDTWDYQLVYSCWINNLLTIIPTKNLVENIGLTSDSTHFDDSQTIFNSLKRGNLIFPLTHPKDILQNRSKDVHTQNVAFGSKDSQINFKNKLVRILNAIRKRKFNLQNNLFKI